VAQRVQIAPIKISNTLVSLAISYFWAYIGLIVSPSAETGHPSIAIYFEQENNADALAFLDHIGINRSGLAEKPESKVGQPDNALGLFHQSERYHQQQGH
jgi:hypothetical protein